MLCCVCLFWMGSTEGTSAFVVVTLGSRNCSVFLSLDVGGFFPISFYMTLNTLVYIRGPKVTAVHCMGSGFAPEREMKVNWGLTSTLEDKVLGGAGFFHFWKGPFPVAGGKGLGMVKTKPPLSVSGFTNFHQVFSNLCKLGASIRGSC